MSTVYWHPVFPAAREPEAAAALREEELPAEEVGREGELEEPRDHRTVQRLDARHVDVDAALLRRGLRPRPRFPEPEGSRLWSPKIYATASSRRLRKMQRTQPTHPRADASRASLC